MEERQSTIYHCVHCGDRSSKKIVYCGNCSTKEKRDAMDAENDKIREENMKPKSP